MLQGLYELRNVELFQACLLLKHKYETGLIILTGQMQLLGDVLTVLMLRSHQ